jgi:hypothetical protein
LVLELYHLTRSAQARRARSNLVFRVAETQLFDDTEPQQLGGDFACGWLADPGGLGEVGSGSASQAQKQRNHGPLIGPSQTRRQGGISDSEHGC